MGERWVGDWAGCTYQPQKCYKRVYTRGLCSQHYYLVRRLGTLGEYPYLRRSKAQRQCSVPSCTHALHARGLCYAHYEATVRPRKGA